MTRKNRLDSSPLHPELIDYWAQHGPEIRQKHEGEFLVLVADVGVKPEYFPDRASALARAKPLGSRALFVPLREGRQELKG